jgi:glycosyltransferase involved in cell wall biosynthesis
MKVVLDVTLLGLIQQWQNARSGIFRVIEQTATGLIADADVDLRLSASESWWNYDQAREYLRKSHELPASLLLPNDLASQTMVILHRFANRPIVGPRMATAGKRVLRRIATPIVRGSSPLRRSDLRNHDVFHSTFSRLPESTKGMRSLQRFMTIYDLIPMLFPETMPAPARQTFERMLASVEGDVHCVCISEATKHDLCNYVSIDPAQVTVAPLAASKDLFFPVTDDSILEQAKSRIGLPRGAQYLLSVNTLQPLKNMTRAIKAFAAFVQETRVEDLYFVLVGATGWNFQQILDTVAHCNLALDRVILAGYVPDDQLAPLYSGALAFIYPSLYEGFGLPPLEAMQCGTPVITGNGSSFPEVVGPAGLLIDPTDQDALSQAMALIYSDDKVRTRLSRAGLDRALTFSWDRYHQTLMSAYRSAIAAPVNYY